MNSVLYPMLLAGFGVACFGTGTNVGSGSYLLAVPYAIIAAVTGTYILLKIRYALPLAALLLLAAPAHAEMLLATVTGGISGCQSQKIEDTFEFGTRNVMGGYWQQVPFVVGTTNFTTGLEDLMAPLFGPPSSYHPSFAIWDFAMPGLINHGVYYSIATTLLQSHTASVGGYVPKHVETVPFVDLPNGVNLEGTAYDLSRLEFTILSANVETLDFGDVVLFGHAVEFQLNIYSSVPEPSSLLLVLLGGVGRVRYRHKVAGVVA